MPNHLAGEKSPYLLQHADNPVDWYPWGTQAFAMARCQDKPVFLSVGYATCHWCHVMAHESFEDDQVARLLNEHFVAIKVDREERPDIDSIYMRACQLMTGGGGWPMSIFMTPDAVPFFAGTYFPKTSRMGMPGFMDILQQIIHLWHHDRERILEAGTKITQTLQKTVSAGGEASLGEKDLQRACKELCSDFDPHWGGFGPPPKFPTPHNLTFLLRYNHRTGDSDAVAMAYATLRTMRDGGIFDQIGYGFHRYSVDKRWLVPHFEKMLYDQALLAMAYLEAFHATGRADLSVVAEEIFSYVLGQMTASTGAFYSAEDADTEGGEGTFYTWTPEEVRAVLSPELAELCCFRFGITKEGNFEGGRSVLHNAASVQACARRFGMTREETADRLQTVRLALLERRKERSAPLKDDKILTSWNGLMSAALAMGGRILGLQKYTQAACRAMQFVWGNLRGDDGRLMRRYRHGQVAYLGCLDDYAFVGWALLELYQTTLDAAWLEKAIQVHHAMVELFGDHKSKGFFFTGQDAEKLILREKDIYDGALPSGNSVALNNLLRLAYLTGDLRWEQEADGLLRCFAGDVQSHPRAYTHFLCGLDWALGPVEKIVLAGSSTDPRMQEMIATLRRLYRPRSLIVRKDMEADGELLTRLAPFVRDLTSVAGQPTAYICRGRHCLAPVTDPRHLVRELDGP